jgi:hypothetical protein
MTSTAGALLAALLLAGGVWLADAFIGRRLQPSRSRRPTPMPRIPPQWHAGEWR